MAKSEVRVIVNLACEQCKQRSYTTTKNKRKQTARLELNKYCPQCRVHALHKEAK